MDWKNLICGKCGSVNDYNENLVNGQNVCRCNGCGNYFGNKPSDYIFEDVVIYFGKYSQSFVCEIEDSSYLVWLLIGDKIKGRLRLAVKEQLKILTGQT